jgi:hypothetical protein
MKNHHGRVTHTAHRSCASIVEGIAGKSAYKDVGALNCFAHTPAAGAASGVFRQDAAFQSTGKLGTGLVKWDFRCFGHAACQRRDTRDPRNDENRFDTMMSSIQIHEMARSSQRNQKRHSRGAFDSY